jgi:hypothetical protein
MLQDKHKRGASYSRTIDIPETLPDGYFIGFDVRSQIRDSRENLIEELDVEWIDPVTTRQLALVCEDTSKWPLGTTYMDILFTRNDGWKISSDTVKTEITRNETR